MQFKFDENRFDRNFQVNEKGLIHKISNSPVKVFPFGTKNNVEEISYEYILSDYFSYSLGEKIILKTNYSDLLEALVENDDLAIDDQDKQIFKNIIKERFFYSDMRFRPDSIQSVILGYDPRTVKKNNEDHPNGTDEKVALYLSDVLGNKDELKQVIENTIERENEDYDALQSYFYEQLNSMIDTAEFSNSSFYKILNTYNELFSDDLTVMK